MYWTPRWCTANLWADSKFPAYRAGSIHSPRAAPAGAPAVTKGARDMRNMGDILRQAQVMQHKIAKMQQEMATKDFEASSGGGMVKAVVTGKQELKALTIDPKALEGGDVEMLQDLILGAVNEAARIARDSMEREMSAISGGIKLPGIF